MHITSLKSKRTRKGVVQTLRQFSEGKASYQEAYDNALKRIQGQGQDDREIAMRTLLVLFHARRPLSAIELCYFVAVDLTDGAGVFDLEDVLELEEILSTCAGLVTYQSETSKVQFVHQSTKEYLKDTEGRWLPNGEATMRDICEVYNGTWEYAEANKGEGNADYLLLGYTKSHWASHHLASETTIPEEEPTPVSTDTCITKCSHGTDQATRYGLRRLGMELNSMGKDLLQTAAYRGQCAMVEVLLAAKSDFELTESKHEMESALVHAVFYGQRDVISLLLEYNTSVHIRDDTLAQEGAVGGGHRLSLLAIAAQVGNLGTIQQLLNWDAGHLDSLLYEDNIIYEGYRFDPYHHVQEFDFIVGALHIDYEPTPDLPMRNPTLSMMSALSLAAYQGHTDIVRYLLRWMNKIAETVDNHLLFTQFQDAAVCALWCSQWDTFMEILPVVGTNMPMRTFFRRPSLFSMACEIGAERFAALLYDDTANIGETDFYHAARNNMAEVVRRMLPNTDKALLNRQDCFGRSMLYRLADEGHTEVVRLLVQRQDLDLNAVDHDMESVLMNTSRNKTTAVLNLLLQRAEVAVNLRSSTGWTALFYHVRKRNVDGVQLLLEREDTQADILDYEGVPPLAYAINFAADIPKSAEIKRYYAREIRDWISIFQLLCTALKRQTPGTLDTLSTGRAKRLRRKLVKWYHIPKRSRPTYEPLITLISVLEYILELAETGKLKLREKKA